MSRIWILQSRAPRRRREQRPPDVSVTETHTRRIVRNGTPLGTRGPTSDQWPAATAPRLRAGADDSVGYRARCDRRVGPRNTRSSSTYLRFARLDMPWVRCALRHARTLITCRSERVRGRLAHDPNPSRAVSDAREEGRTPRLIPRAPSDSVELPDLSTHCKYLQRTRGGPMLQMLEFFAWSPCER